MATGDLRVPLKLRFSGRSVEQNGLDLYDGSTSFHGFAQAIQIAIHAYQTREIVSRSTALRKAAVFFASPKSGSVLFNLTAVLNSSPTSIGKTANTFYDFLRIAFSKATGQSKVPPLTGPVENLAESTTFFDELSETLEGSLQRAHRAIDNDAAKVTLERPRSALITFNQASSQWVNTRDENPAIEEFTGNVTRYNSISGNARAYISQLKKVVPVRPGNHFPDSKRGHLTWSLHGNTTDGSKELKFWASRIESAQGEAKRLVLEDCAVAQ